MASYVFDAAFVPGKELLLAAEINTRRSEVWILDGGAVRHFSWERVNVGGESHMGHTAYPVFSADDRYICTGSEDGTARLWPTPHTIRSWMSSPD